MSTTARGLTLIPLAAALFACAAALPDAGGDRWSEEEMEELRSLWIGELEPPPADPTNRVADDPAAVSLGHRLFFDERFSVNGKVACATCHLPQRDFQDDLALGRGVGVTNRRTMPIAGTSRSPWLFWDGRKDSQWSQALGPLESPVEHGGNRALYVHLIAEHYADEYQAIFGPLPDLTSIPRNAGPVEDPAARVAWETMTEADREAVTRAFVNIGKAIAAYERRIEPGASRVDEYIGRLIREGRAPEGVLTQDEVAGMRIFIGKGNCTQCHNGPLLTDDFFHNTGVPVVDGLPEDLGRAAGAALVLDDEFNCRSPYSDAGEIGCPELDFLVADGDALVRAFKTPSLRNVADRAPYMHAGQIASLADVIEHYNRAPGAPAGHSELEPLRLSAREKAQLEAYLRALSAPLHAPDRLLDPPEPSSPAEAARREDSPIGPASLR